jgi:hypothetical protein
MVKLANPLRKNVCPICGEDYYPGNCAIVSNSGQVLQEAHTGFLARAFVTPLEGRKLIKARAQRQCPYCGGRLPPNDDYVKNYTIAIVGDSVSGKSHYLASCIHQLKQDHALQVIGCSSVIGQGNTDENYYNTYYLPIYLNRQKILATQPGIRYDPLIYELVFPERSALQPAKTVNLLFYDSSGEDIIEQNNMVVYSQYILNASAIIFLADPMQMPGVVKALPNHLKPTPDLVRRLTTSEVLNRVLETFKRSQRIRPGQKLKTPIAITVSKSDLLKFVAKGRQSPLFLNDNVYANQLDLPKFDYISNEVQAFLYSAGDRVLLRSSELFEDVCFFAVSATGWPPDDQGAFPPLEPVRCLDPLVWALWRLGIINVG